ncbi:hypothetical protein ACIBG8_26585 [Nonomuraea sp. NPDC050556]|uniref:hypothetical protein n=1 Tax=Nonomuraea sp. NPDC050556 TaxID=3364369 RepID=UPI00379A2097
MTFLSEPAGAGDLYSADEAELGYVMNASRVWGHNPALMTALFDQLSTIVKTYGLTMRQRGILVAACASSFGDSYCSLAWGNKLASISSPEVAAAVLRGTDEGLSSSEQALATWARKTTQNPNKTTQADIDTLRAAGFTDPQILGITLFVALRVAFSTVNDALGAQPDRELRTTTPPIVLSAVTYGRPTA